MRNLIEISARQVREVYINSKIIAYLSQQIFIFMFFQLLVTLFKGKTSNVQTSNVQTSKVCMN